MQRISLVLGITALFAASAAHANTDQCKTSIQNTLIEQTRNGLVDPSKFQMKSVGWFADESVRDQYTMTIYYKDLRSGRTGMTTAIVTASDRVCKLQRSNFFLFDKR